jgi:hypothetical protein
MSLSLMPVHVPEKALSKQMIIYIISLISTVKSNIPEIKCSGRGFERSVKFNFNLVRFD